MDIIRTGFTKRGLILAPIAIFRHNRDATPRAAQIMSVGHMRSYEFKVVMDI